MHHAPIPTLPANAIGLIKQTFYIFYPNIIPISLGANEPLKSNQFIYKAVDQQSGQTVGHISLGRIDRENLSGRIGKVLVVSSHTRGAGIGLQMINAVLKIGFAELKLHRISLGVFDFNHAAIRCYEKAGFIREGLLRDARKCTRTAIGI